ncbi:MAG TPA: response regulator [Sphingomonas sp.]|nr:response regulator [Sphingomonas sp.]
MRILVAEDEPLLAFDIEHNLSGQGFEIVATVDSVSDAVAMMGSDRAIDLALVDMTLVDGSGIDVARAAQRHGVQVMFVTGECPVEARTLSAGCLSKPYPQRDLTAAIDALEKVLGGVVPKRLPASFSLFATPA